jgi:two-component system, chemotaxis family, response regulator WspF
MRIAIVNDLPLAVEALRRTLALEPEHELIWVAGSGEEAVAQCARDRPALLLLDLIMPGMDGVEATRQIMAASPCAILIATSSIGRNEARVFEAMGHGALDVVEIPPLDAADTAAAARVLGKIATLGRLIRDDDARPTALPRAGAPSDDWLLAFGASAGGPAALARVLAALPVTLPAAIVIVQHVDAHFAQGMAAWLRQQSAWPVRLALQGDRPQRGVALLAGTSDHLVLESAERLGYTPQPLEYVYRPSIDVFFQSVAREWRGVACGVLLTGMGRDGALGLKAMRDKGHHTLTQDEASSAVFGMPKAAAKLDAAVEIAALDAIGPRLLQRISERQRAKL